MEEVKKIWLDYKEYTINVINLLKKDEFDNLEDEIEKMQLILNKLISFPEQKEESKKIYENLKIEELQNKAEEIIRAKSFYIKEKLEEISKGKRATSAYGKLPYGAAIFSKKI